ncbi:hypothetical protein [Bdellovibrio sp. HCB337]|uniref:hypothetical protein n=1 Tax=Bdellovibrio sp. HCB337 TaxID=3394358 RepID=UPI0039A63652
MKATFVLLGLVLSTTSAFAQAEALEYKGSSFAEVLQVLEDHDFTPSSEGARYEKEVYATRLPQYPMNMLSVFQGSGTTLERDAVRTLSERFDYYDRLPKKLHPNGVCVTGEWKIQENTPYSGYFAKGSQGLFVGRISVAMDKTTSKDDRGFGVAGKVFPTMNAHEVVKTGNFFTVDVLMGEDTPHVLDARTTNEPESGFSLGLISFAFKIASVLKKVDENPMFRPLTQVAALSEPGAVKQPKWLRLSVDKSVQRNNEKDFRHEVLTAMQENKKITYAIEVSDTTKDRSAKSGWKKIGEIVLDHAVVSYGCDRRLHFAHPKLK